MLSSSFNGSAVARTMAVAGLVLLFAGCGFQLRGQADLPDSMARTYIAAEDRLSLFYRTLRADLSANGVDVVDSPASATAILNILYDRSGQRVLSVSARNVPREFEVFYTVGFSLDVGETIALEAQEQTVARNYTYDERLVLGKAHEEEILREAIAADVVRLVMYQLASL